MPLIDKEFIKSMRNDQMLQDLVQIFKISDVKSLMLKLIISNILNVININRNQLRESKYYMNIKTEFKTFQWSLKQYMQRLTASDKYMNVLRYENPHSLNIFKFMSDLKNLESLLLEILNSSNRALDTLKDCKKKLTIQEDLTQDLENETKVLNHKNKELQNYNTYRQNQQNFMKDRFNNFADNVMDELLIIDPAILRYKSGVMKEQTEEFIDTIDKKRNDVQKAIDDARVRFAIDELAHDQIMDLYKKETETLREKVKYWSEKYNDVYEVQSLKNSELKLKVTAMENNYETLRNRLQAFRIELAGLEGVHAHQIVQKDIQDKEKEIKYKPLKSKLNRKKKQISLAQKVQKNVAAF